MVYLYPMNQTERGTMRTCTFQANGYNFIGKIDENSTMGVRSSVIPDEMLTAFFADCATSLELSPDNLEKFNAGASWAWIELAQ